MSTENPFEVSEFCSGNSNFQQVPESETQFHIEGDILVCRKAVILPRICVLTGKKDNLIAKQQMVQFPSWRPILMQRSCSVTYFVDQPLSRRRTAVFGVSLVMSIAGLFLLFGLIKSWGWSPILVIAGWLPIFIVILYWGADVICLRLSDYQSPGVYRVRGFPQEYLDKIAMLQHPRE